MPRRHCKTCIERLSTLMPCSAGLIALTVNVSLASLRSRIAFFSESDTAPRALPFSSSQGLVRKKQQGRGFEQPVTSELASAQCPCASLSRREHSPVLFTQLDQRPSAAPSDMISFGVSDNERDDCLSLAASDAEELSGSVADPALLTPSASCSARLKADDKLIRVMPKAVNELGVEWSPPEEPYCSRLDEWFLPGHHQALRQSSSPFFPEVHDELTKSWRAPYSSRICPSTSAALTSINGAEEKGYEHLPPLDEFVVAHICPPTEGTGETSIQAVQSYICTHWTRLLNGWTACFSAALDVQVLLCFRSFKQRCTPMRMPVWILPHSGT